MLNAYTQAAMTYVTRPLWQGGVLCGAIYWALCWLASAHDTGDRRHQFPLAVIAISAVFFTPCLLGHLKQQLAQPHARLTPGYIAAHMAVADIFGGAVAVVAPLLIAWRLDVELAPIAAFAIIAHALVALAYYSGSVIAGMSLFVTLRPVGFIGRFFQGFAFGVMICFYSLLLPAALVLWIGQLQGSLAAASAAALLACVFAAALLALAHRRWRQVEWG